MTSRDEYYAIAEELKKLVTDSLFPPPFECVFVAGSIELIQSLGATLETVFARAGLRTEVVPALSDLPEDAPLRGPLLFVASGSVAEVLRDPAWAQSSVRSILLVGNPLVLTTDLPRLLHRGVLDVLAHNASAEELLAALCRLGEAVPRLPGEIMARMRGCAAMLGRASCVDKLPEASRNKVRDRISNLNEYVAMSEKFYLAAE